MHGLTTPKFKTDVEQLVIFLGFMRSLEDVIRSFGAKVLPLHLDDPEMEEACCLETCITKRIQPIELRFYKAVT